jgi:hypothetical protein
MGYEKLGSDQAQLAGFGGGVISEEGAVLLSGDSTGQESLLLGPALLREVQAGVANGDFAIPPPDPLATIVQDGNALPYWTFTDVNSAGAITCAIVEDTGSASGNVLRWTVTGSTGTGKSATLSRYVPVIGSRGRSFAYAYDSYWRSATASTAITATLSFEFFDATLTSAGSGATTAATFTTIGAGYDLSAPEWSGATIDAEFANTTSPNNAAFIKVTITIATIAAVSAGNKTIDLAEVRQIVGGAGLLMPDLTNPSGFSTGAIYQDSGAIQIMPVAGDTLGLYGRLDVSPNVVITAPDGATIYSETTTPTLGTLYVATVDNLQGDLRLRAAGADVIVQDTNAADGTNPRIIFRPRTGADYAALKSGAVGVMQVLSGSSTTTYGQLWAARIYPMNGSTASRYIFDDGTNTAFSGSVLAGSITSTGTVTANTFTADTITGTTATTNAAIWVLTAGTTYNLRRNTSSARYKTAITDADDAVLTAARQVRPRHYESTIADEQGATRLGFIAEEVHDAGLTHAVGYDAEGRPETLDSTALIAALWHRVNDLEARLAAVEAQQ